MPIKNEEIVPSLDHYILKHNILDRLKRISWIITGRSSESFIDDYDMVPLYDLNLTSAELPFGTLVHVLNNPAYLSTLPIATKQRETHILSRKKIDISLYSFEEVASALAVLQANGEVVVGIFEGVQLVKWTQKGYTAYVEEKYLNLYRKERDSQLLHESTISTNRVTKANTIASIVIGMLLLAIGYLTYEVARLTNLREERRYIRESYSQDTAERRKGINDSLDQSWREQKYREAKDVYESSNTKKSDKTIPSVNKIAR